MSDFHLKQAGVYHLKRMDSLMRIKCDKRYRLSDDEDIKRLLWDAVSLNDVELISEFTLFFINCWPITQTYIRRQALVPNLDTVIKKVIQEKSNQLIAC